MTAARAIEVTGRPDWPAGARLVAFDTVGSTNDEARRLLAEGAGDLTWIWARRQETGRGRRGRTWVSPEGNLYCSVLLRPTRPTTEVAQLSFVAALAVRDAVLAVGTLDPGRVRLKWPNDVLVNGRKVSGILLEAEPDPSGMAVVAGIGINLRAHPEATAYPATALASEGIVPPPAAQVLAVLAGNFQQRYTVWQSEGFARVREAWLAVAHGVGEVLTARLAGADTVEGRFADLDPAGALIVELPGGGRRVIAAGDVFFRSAAEPGE